MLSLRQVTVTRPQERFPGAQFRTPPSPTAAASQKELSSLAGPGALPTPSPGSVPPLRDSEDAGRYSPRRSLTVPNPEAAELQAAVGPGGCCNPLGAAGLGALPAAASSSCWRGNRVGGAGPQSPVAGRLLPAGGVSAGGGLGAWGFFRAPPPGSPPAPEAAAGRSGWAPGGSRGRCGPRNPAAGDWSPPLQRQRLEKEGVRLWESRMRGKIRLGNQEKGREGERRLHMTSRSQ